MKTPLANDLIDQLRTQRPILPPLSRLQGFAYTLLGWGLWASYVLHGVWAFSVWCWWSWRGRSTR
jgi:hypothetical protein